MRFAITSVVPKETQRTRWLEEREQAAALRHDAYERTKKLFRENLDLVERFRSAMANHFKQVVEGKVFKRKPTIRVRLVVSQDPPTTLTIAPQWDKRVKVIDPECVNMRLTAEQITQSNGSVGTGRE